MASYIFNYNGVNLSNLARVRSVETTDLPPRENNAITIWERPGSIYNSYRYGERDIVVTFLVRATASEYRSNPNCMENKLWQLRSVFRVDEPKPLYLGTTSKYILAVPEGDYTVTELRYDCYECKIQFVCHIPEYYAATVSSNKSRTSGTYGMRNSSNNNTIDIYNKGDASAYPIINIGINNDASFIQVENTTNGNKFLIGNYPKVGQKPAKTSNIIINDPMIEQGPWLYTPPYIDADRHCEGRGRITNDGSGIMLSSTDNTSSLWKGIGGHQDFVTPLVNFEVRAKLRFNSYGVDGDPTVPQHVDEGAIINGNREYCYKVIAPSVPIKDSMSSFGHTVGSYDKGQIIYPASPTVTNGWIRTPEGAYCEVTHFRRYIDDRTITEAAMNVTINAEEVELWSRPSNDPSDSLLLATIPRATDTGRTVLRVERYTDNGYYKLYIPYNGKVGYIDSYKVSMATGEGICYPEDDIIVSDDTKTGICEVYGYNSKGIKLFKLSLADDNEYYSLVKPSVEVGDKVVLEDITATSGSNKAINDNDTNVGYDSLLEGASGNWNEFYGELGIKRKDNKWEAWVYKMENGVATKKLVLKEQEFSGAPTEELSYVAFYIGTQDMDKRCSMAITHMQVIELLDDNSDGSKVLFRPGDEIKIDCCNNVVYLNNKLYNDIDIDSQFIELVTGNNMLKVTSDDTDAFASVLFNEKYL